MVTHSSGYAIFNVREHHSWCKFHASAQYYEQITRRQHYVPVFGKFVVVVLVHSECAITIAVPQESI